MIPSDSFELDPFIESESHLECPPPTIPKKYDRIDTILDE